MAGDETIATSGSWVGVEDRLTRPATAAEVNACATIPAREGLEVAASSRCFSAETVCEGSVFSSASNRSTALGSCNPPSR